MIVTVILPAAKLDKVKQGLESQKSAGISFEYFTNVAEVFTLINERGFYMDKLVFIASVLADFNDADMQVLIDNLCNVCELYLLDDTKNKEILMIDSGLLFEMEYHQFFHPYPSFIYQSQKVHPSQLFGLIAGNFITAENPNVIEESKKPSFFSKVFGKKKQAATETADAVSDEPPVPEASDQQQVQYSDAPLFADVDVEESKSTQEQNDLDFDINFSSQPEKEEQAEPIEDLSNTPLFEDEPESEPKPEPEPKVDIQKEQRRFSSPFKNKQPPLQKNTATAQVAKVATRSKKVIAKTYIEFFQKRSKIVLFTGDRRSARVSFDN